VLKSNLLVKLSCGIVGSIFYRDVFESKESSNCLSQYYSEGQPLRMRIKSIDYEKFRAELTILKSEMKMDREQLREIFDEWIDLEKYFKIKEEVDFPIFNENHQGKILKFAPQRVDHEKFRSITAAAAVELLIDKPIGEVIKNLILFKINFILLSTILFPCFFLVCSPSIY
jgi:hypothetical protein